MPVAWYHDRHGIFPRAASGRETPAEQLAGRREPIQVGRALSALGIPSASAHFPQAKGRIERLFGTLRDRLVAELRLAQAHTQAEATAVLQRFLPDFNTRFAVPPADPVPAFRPPLPAEAAWQPCCFRFRRTVAPDDTVRLDEHPLPLLPTPARRTYARTKVEVREHLDGSLRVWHDGVAIATQPAPAKAPLLRARGGRGTLDPPTDPTPVPPPSALLHDDGCRETTTPELARSSPPTPFRPAAAHPWRRPFSANATKSRDSECHRFTGQQRRRGRADRRGTGPPVPGIMGEHDRARFASRSEPRQRVGRSVRWTGSVSGW